MKWLSLIIILIAFTSHYGHGLSLQPQTRFNGNLGENLNETEFEIRVYWEYVKRKHSREKAQYFLFLEARMRQVHIFQCSQCGEIVAVEANAITGVTQTLCFKHQGIKEANAWELHKLPEMPKLLKQVVQKRFVEIILKRYP